MNKILKGNKLIAEFMTEEPEVLAKDLLKAGTLESMQYNSSMDWLYPVYQKICLFRDTLTYKVLDTWSRMLLNEAESDCSMELAVGNKVLLIFEAVVKWIKVYNLKVKENEKQVS
jgi:hypothetical protein